MRTLRSIDLGPGIHHRKARTTPYAHLVTYTPAHRSNTRALRQFPGEALMPPQTPVYTTPLDLHPVVTPKRREPFYPYAHPHR